MEVLAAICIQFSGYILAALSVWLLVRCARSMLRERYEPEIWAYLGFPDGSRTAINHWECILGRSGSSDIVLKDPTVSRSHAALQRNDRGVWRVYDLGSRGGTARNGEAVASSGAEIRSGDELRLAGTVMRFLEPSREQLQDIAQRRTVPGRAVHPGVTLLMLSIFQIFLALQHSLAAAEAFGQPIVLAFLALAVTEWICYFMTRSLRRTGFEVETLAFYLTSVGLSVAASSVPEDIVKQCLLILSGIVLFFVLGWWLRSLRRVRSLRWFAAAGALGLLALNLLVSREMFGAKNWLTVAGFTFQPSEFVKVAYIYVGAATLDRLFTGRNLFLFIGFSAACVGALALMGDFGTAFIFFAAFLVISFLRSGSFATVFLAVSGAGLAGFLVLSVKPYIARRFAAWGHVWEDPLGKGFQQVRAMCAASSGGLFGHGAGRGWLHNIVAADTDLVFGMVCEELGLIVAVCCMLALLVLAAFTVRNAAAGRSSYYVIAACAAVSMMMIQMGLNVFGSLDILPFTGVTFPFVSRGGSSLISCWALLAFVKASDTRRNASFVVKPPSRYRGAEDEEEEYEEDEEEEARE